MLTTPVDRQLVLLRLVDTAPRAGSFPAVALAFPDPIPVGIHDSTFRGLLKLHSRYGPLICSPTITVGLVGRLRRRPLPVDAASQLLRHTDILLRRDLHRAGAHPLVFRAVRAHLGFVGIDEKM